MAWCETTDIREQNAIISNPDEVSDPKIVSAIIDAEIEIKVDLSGYISESDLDNAGANSLLLKKLCIYKSVELLLVEHYGNYRQGDRPSDIVYYQDRYNKWIESILNGDIKITLGDDDQGPKSFPAINTNNLSLYPRKGIDGFIPEGGTEDKVDFDQ